jgi:hypothetical protein
VSIVSKTEKFNPGYYRAVYAQRPIFFATRGKGGRYKPGPADFLKTISIGFIAGGLIFKGLIGLFVTGYSAITLEE